MKDEREGQPPSAEKLVADIAGSAVKAAERDLAPLSDELKRDLRETSRTLALAAGATALGALAVQMALLAVTEVLARRMRRSTAAFAVSSLLGLGAWATGAYARLRLPTARGRRLLERIAAIIQSPVRGTV